MIQTVGYTDSDQYKCLENLKKGSIDLCLTYCGWEKCESGHRFGPNKRISHVLHIVDSGKGVLETNNKRYELAEGDSFLILSGTDAYYQADKKDPWTYRWVGFEGLQAKEIVQAAGYSKLEPVRHINCADTVNAYVDAMIQTNQLVFGNELKRTGLLMLLFSELLEDNRETCLREGRMYTEHRYPNTVYVDHAVEYISQNFASHIKINEVADYVGVNRSYLSSSFKKILGCSPQDYLINLRIEKAKSLLKKGDTQINEVAGMVGYADPLAFSKVFKSRTGRSPSEYKEEKRKLVVAGHKGDYTDSQP